jgi:hypothetical protein
MTATPILTEAEAARYLRIGERTLRDIRRRGQIRYIALTARKIAYRPEDCEEYLAARVRVEQPCDTRQKPKRARSQAGGGKIIPFSKLIG